MKVKKIPEKWEIWDKEEEIAKSEEETKKLVPQIFYKQIYGFGKKTSKRMPMKKIWDYTIEVKKNFILQKKKIYLLSREEKGEVYEFIYSV